MNITNKLKLKGNVTAVNHISENGYFNAENKIPEGVKGGACVIQSMYAFFKCC